MCPSQVCKEEDPAVVSNKVVDAISAKLTVRCLGCLGCGPSERQSPTHTKSTTKGSGSRSSDDPDPFVVDSKPSEKDLDCSTTKMAAGSVAKHALHCPGSLVKCGNSNCSWRGTLRELEAHLTSDCLFSLRATEKAVENVYAELMESRVRARGDNDAVDPLQEFLDSIKNLLQVGIVVTPMMVYDLLKAGDIFFLAKSFPDFWRQLLDLFAPIIKFVPQKGGFRNKLFLAIFNRCLDPWSLLGQDLPHQTVKINANAFASALRATAELLHDIDSASAITSGDKRNPVVVRPARILRKWRQIKRIPKSRESTTPAGERILRPPRALDIPAKYRPDRLEDIPALQRYGEQASTPQQMEQLRILIREHFDPQMRGIRNGFRNLLEAFFCRCSCSVPNRAGTGWGEQVGGGPDPPNGSPKLGEPLASPPARSPFPGGGSLCRENLFRGLVEVRTFLDVLVDELGPESPRYANWMTQQQHQMLNADPSWKATALRIEKKSDPFLLAAQFLPQFRSQPIDDRLQINAVHGHFFRYNFAPGSHVRMLGGCELVPTFVVADVRLDGGGRRGEVADRSRCGPVLRRAEASEAARQELRDVHGDKDSSEDVDSFNF